VDISDLIVEEDPEIKVEVTIIGFKIKVRRSNKWIVIVSNKFEKPIRKTKWVVNEYKHVKVSCFKQIIISTYLYRQLIVFLIR